MGIVTDPKSNHSGNEDIAAVKQAFYELEKIVLEHCPDSRRRNIALTNLETAAMYAVKSIAEGS